MSAPYEIWYNGKYAYSLNQGLAERQGVTPTQLAALSRLHVKKLSLFELAKLATSKLELHKMAEDLEVIEYEMQRNWNFPIDRNFHEWYLLPQCTCPKRDNAERRGTEYRIVKEDCPAHGKRDRGE